MSTGPDHFREAERLLTLAGRATSGSPTELIALAQVHATLAHTAAVIDASGRAPITWDDVMWPR